MRGLVVVALIILHLGIVVAFPIPMGASVELAPPPPLVPLLPPEPLPVEPPSLPIELPVEIPALPVDSMTIPDPLPAEPVPFPLEIPPPLPIPPVIPPVTPPPVTPPPVTPPPVTPPPVTPPPVTPPPVTPSPVTPPPVTPPPVTPPPVTPPPVTPPPVTPPPVTPPPVTPPPVSLVPVSPPFESTRQYAMLRALTAASLTLTIPDARVAVQVGESSIPTGATIAVWQIFLSEIAGSLQHVEPIGMPVAIGLRTDNGEKGSFSKPITLSITIPVEVSSSALSKLGLFILDEDHGIWVRVPASYESSSRVLTAKADEPGIFAVLVDTVAAFPPMVGTSLALGRRVDVQGYAEPLATVLLERNGVVIGEAVSDRAGEFTVSVMLPLGRHNVFLRQRDQVGNTSLPSQISLRTEYILEITMTLGNRNITVNDAPRSLDVPPRVLSGRTFVPVRFIAESLGAAVTWTAHDNSARIQYGATTIVLPVGRQNALVNGVSTRLDSPAFIVQGRTLVPIRFISETLGMEVTWHEATQTVVLRQR